MALGWAQLGGFLGKIGDHLLDPVKQADRKIRKLETERRKLAHGKSTSDSSSRLTDIDIELVQLRKDRDRLLRSR